MRYTLDISAVDVSAYLPKDTEGNYHILAPSIEDAFEVAVRLIHADDGTHLDFEPFDQSKVRGECYGDPVHYYVQTVQGFFPGLSHSVFTITSEPEVLE